MSRKAKVDPNVQAQQNQSIANVRVPTPGEAMLQQQAQGTMDWINKGDYRVRPKNLFLNFADPAGRDQQRRMMMNAGGQGVSALGAPSPNLLAMNKQNLDDEWARDSAGQYEQDVSMAQNRALGALGDTAQLANQRNLGALGATSGMWGQSLQASAMRRPWWETLLGQAGQGAMAAATAFSDKNMKDDVEPIKDALKTVSKLDGKSYKWKANGQQDAGVIAQDVEKVLPNLVTHHSSGNKMVNYAGVTGVLVSAVNELNKKLEGRK